MTDNLMPCPFCGGDAHDQSHDSCDCCGKIFTGIIQCKKCGAEVSHFDTVEQAIAAWNMRQKIITVHEFVIGDYTISNFAGGKIFIRHNSGEGGTFNKHDLRNVIDQFYQENF